MDYPASNPVWWPEQGTVGECTGIAKTQNLLRPEHIAIANLIFKIF
jgi:hypothetical protein